MRWALPGADLQADDPVHPSGPRPVMRPVYPQVGGVHQPAVPARDGLVGDAEHRGEHAERCPRRHDQRVEKLAVNLVELTGFHGYKLNDVEFRRDRRRIWGSCAVYGRMYGECD